MTELGKELKRGTLELILLQLLDEKEMYGYELVKTLEERSEGYFQTREGTLYPVLYRLEDQRCIAHRWENPERGVPRKYYRVTSEGRIHLRIMRGEWNSLSKFVNGILTGEEEGNDR